MKFPCFRAFLFTAVIVMFSLPASAGEKDDFEKGFYIGMCRTLIETFPSGNEMISKFQFYITNKKGRKIKTFSLDRSIKRLIEVYGSEESINRARISRFIGLIGKYRTGEIMAKELKLFTGIYYFLIYRSKPDSIKFGFLISQIYSSVVFIRSASSPRSVKKKAYKNLWRSIEHLLMFSPHFFDTDLSDKLFIAYMKRDIKTITGISVAIIVKKMKIPDFSIPVM